MTRALRIHLAAAGGAGALALILSVAGDPAFARVLGPLPGWAAVLILALAGALALPTLERTLMAGSAGLGQTARLTALGAAFALPMVALDTIRPFPADINVPLPAALAFYPAIAFVAETAFHILPLALLTRLLPGSRGVWPAILMVAAIEPGYQVALGDGDPRDIAMAAWLYLFALFQLSAFRRHGIAALFATRLGYYLVWHILWGAARLPVLFGPA